MTTVLHYIAHFTPLDAQGGAFFLTFVPRRVMIFVSVTVAPWGRRTCGYLTVRRGGL